MSTTAVFLDRDGTIIEDVGYLSDPDAVRLLPGAAEALRRLRNAGHQLVIVSNQSGVARGILDEKRLGQVHARLESLLRAEGVRLDGAYYCPYLDGPEATVEKYRADSALRKPQPGMLLQAASEMKIDLRRSWMVGNSPSDVQAGRSAGCRTILLANNGTPQDTTAGAADHVVESLLAACDRVERGDMDSEERNFANAPSAPDEVPSEGAVLRMLGKIHDQLDRAQRNERQHDFSILRLFGALLQMLAIMTAAWGLSALFEDESVTATARFVLACFFQLASVSAFAIDRFR